MDDHVEDVVGVDAEEAERDPGEVVQVVQLAKVKRLTKKGKFFIAVEC